MQASGESSVCQHTTECLHELNLCEPCNILIDCVQNQSTYAKIDAINEMLNQGIISQETALASRTKMESELSHDDSTCQCQLFKSSKVVFCNPYATVETFLTTVGEGCTLNCKNPFDPTGPTTAAADYLCTCLDEDGDRVAGDTCKLVIDDIVDWFSKLFGSFFECIERSVVTRKSIPVRNSHPFHSFSEHKLTQLEVVDITTFEQKRELNIMKDLTNMTIPANKEEQENKRSSRRDSFRQVW